MKGQYHLKTVWYKPGNRFSFRCQRAPPPACLAVLIKKVIKRNMEKYLQFESVDIFYMISGFLGWICLFLSFSFCSFHTFILERPAAFGARDKNDRVGLIPVLWVRITNSESSIILLFTQKRQMNDAGRQRKKKEKEVKKGRREKKKEREEKI